MQEDNILLKNLPNTLFIIKGHKIHIFWEGHKILWNIHLTFVLSSASQK